MVPLNEFDVICRSGVTVQEVSEHYVLLLRGERLTFSSIELARRAVTGSALPTEEWQLYELVPSSQPGGELRWIDGGVGPVP